VSNVTSLIQSQAQGLASRLTEVRRDLHRHPELSLEEVRTTARLREWLTEAGLTILPLDLRVGIVAEVRGAKPGPVVAIRSDIDALPILEETGLEYASTVTGKMHACGHDFHMATVLGAALVLQQVRGELAGTVRFLFQPAEETAHGAKLLIGAGALEGVSAVFGLHNKPDLPAGHVGLKSGPLMAASDSITISISGKGGHAAIPDATIDPVVAGSAIVMALQTAVSRTVSPLDAAVVSIGSFQAGTTHNVIPPSARLMGTIRTFTPAVRDKVQATAERIVRDVAAAYGASATVEWDKGTPAVTNDPAMAEVVRRAAEALEMPVGEAVPTMGAEDFAEYQGRVPGCFIWLGTGCAENWHHPRFMVDEAVIPQGAALFARIAVEALSSLS
jgi:N-acetylcysteine deacetylase